MHAGGHISELLALRQALACLVWWLNSTGETEIPFVGEGSQSIFSFFKSLLPKRCVRRTILWRVVLFGALFGGHCVGGARDVPHVHFHGVWGGLSTWGCHLGNHHALLESQWCRMVESRALRAGGLEFELWLYHFLDFGPR